jgi:hypothetical protein
MQLEPFHHEEKFAFRLYFNVVESSKTFLQFL